MRRALSSLVRPSVLPFTVCIKVTLFKVMVNSSLISAMPSDMIDIGKLSSWSMLVTVISSGAVATKSTPSV